ATKRTTTRLLFRSTETIPFRLTDTHSERASNQSRKSERRNRSSHTIVETETRRFLYLATGGAEDSLQTQSASAEAAKIQLLQDRHHRPALEAAQSPKEHLVALSTVTVVAQRSHSTS